MTRAPATIKQADVAPPGFVYFVHNGEHVKIGWSKDWKGRLRTLQTSNPAKLKIMLVIVGSRADEGDLHAEFQADRVRGEWYRPTQQIVAFIEAKEAARLNVAGRYMF